MILYQRLNLTFNSFSKRVLSKIFFKVSKVFVSYSEDGEDEGENDDQDEIEQDEDAEVEEYLVEHRDNITQTIENS